MNKKLSLPSLFTSLGFVLCLMLPLSAQNKVPSLDQINPNTEIKSDQFEFLLKGRQGIYQGNVIVEDSQMRLTCDRLTVELSETGAGFDQVVAHGHVVILSKEDQTKAQGDHAVYSAKTQLVELTGNPSIDTPQGMLTGDKVIFNRRENRISATGNIRMQLRPDMFKQSSLLPSMSTRPGNSPAK